MVRRKRLMYADCHTLSGVMSVEVMLQTATCERTG
jgi:hypothetical protein